MFTAFIIASFHSSVTYPQTTLPPERLAALVKLLEKPTQVYEDRDLKIRRMYCLSGKEHYELVEHPDPAPVIAIFKDRTKPSESRAEAAVILCEKLRGYFRKPDESILKHVLAALADDDLQVRKGAIRIISFLGISFYSEADPPRYYPQHAYSPALVERLVIAFERLAKEQDDECCSWALNSLGLHNLPMRGVEQALAAVKRKSPIVRASACGVLTRNGRDDPRSLPAVMAQLDPKNDPAAYAAAVVCSGWFGGEAKAAVPELIRIVGCDPTEKGVAPLQHAAVQSLGRIGVEAKAALPVLDKYRQLPDNNFRRETIVAMILIDASVGMPIMDKYLKEQAIFQGTYKPDLPK